MLGVYTLVFRFVFKLRWGGGGDESNLTFALRLFAGLAVFNFFARRHGFFTLVRGSEPEFYKNPRLVGAALPPVAG